MGGFIVTITIRLVLVWSPPSSLPLKPLLTSLKAIARDFFVLFHISIWSPSAIYCHLHLLLSPFPLLLLSPTHPVPILQSCLLLLIFKLMFKCVSQSMPTMGIFYFGLFNSCHYSSLPLSSPPPFSTSFTTHPYIFYLHILYFTTLLMLYHSLFPFLLSLNSIEYFHYWNRVLHLSCMIRLVFVYMFIFWIYLRHMRENMWPLCFWAWLTSLNMISSNCFYLPSNICHYSLWVKLHEIYIFMWYIYSLLHL
jgi:hypothetical protein